jgi:hypothetical protein
MTSINFRPDTNGIISPGSKLYQDKYERWMCVSVVVEFLLLSDLSSTN